MAITPKKHKSGTFVPLVWYIFSYRLSRGKCGKQNEVRCLGQLEFIARCDKFQSYEQLRCVMIALRQVMNFRKRKRYEFRLRRNVAENAARFDFILL